MERLPHQSRFRNVAGRQTESQHEINVDTCIPATLLKHAKACKRNIHEVPRDDNSLFSALADQLTDAKFTGHSLRDKIEAFIFDQCSSEQHESFLLSNPNSRQDTHPTIQDAADFLRHSIVLYRDDDNAPSFFQPIGGHNPIFQILHIGCTNNKYYVSFRPHDYIKEFEPDVSYIPHAKTHDQMTTIRPLMEDSEDSGSSGYASALSASGSKSQDDSAPSLLDAVKELPSDADSDEESDHSAPSLLDAVKELPSDAASDEESDHSAPSLLDAVKEIPPSLLDANRELRSLLTKNLSVAVQREFARLQRLSINDPDTDGALNTMKWNVFVISSGGKQIGTAFSLGNNFMLTAGHVIGGEKYLQAKNKLRSMKTRSIGISSIADVGVLRSFRDIFPCPIRLGIDFGTESCTYIYVVGYVDGNMSPQGEKCPVLPPRDKDDGYIRFQSKLFYQGSSGSPCLVFKDGEFVVKGILVGREEGTDMPYELIAITFRCLWKRLGLP